MCVITSTNRITPSPECRAFKSLYKTSAVSLFTPLPTPTLLVAHSITAHTSLSQLCSCAYLFCILSHGFFEEKRDYSQSNLEANAPPIVPLGLEICCFTVSIS